MKKHFKPVVTSVMVLAIGFSLSACGQNYTVKQNSMRARNDVQRIETKTTPYGTNMTDRRINNYDMTYGVDPLLNNNTNGTNRTYGMNGTDGTVNRSGVDHQKRSGQLANRAEKVSGVKKATVVIHNKDAIVGIDVDNTGKKAIIEKQVYAALKGQYPEYNIHVTSDQGMHQRINSMNTSMISGHPVKTFANDVNMLIQDIGNAITAPFR